MWHSNPQSDVIILAHRALTGPLYCVNKFILPSPLQILFLQKNSNFFNFYTISKPIKHRHLNAFNHNIYKYLQIIIKIFLDVSR